MTRSVPSSFFTPQHDMNVRVIGVVMAHGEIRQLRLKVALNLRHEVVSERFEVKVLAFLRAQNEPEVVPIVGPIGDRMAQIRALNSAPIERYPCPLPAFPDAVPHQIPYMLEESVDCFRAATSPAKASFEDDALVQTAPGTNELSSAEMSPSASCSERRSDRGRHRKVSALCAASGSATAQLRCLQTPKTALFVALSWQHHHHQKSRHISNLQHLVTSNVSEKSGKDGRLGGVVPLAVGIAY